MGFSYCMEGWQTSNGEFLVVDNAAICAEEGLAVWPWVSKIVGDCCIWNPDSSGCVAFCVSSCSIRRRTKIGCKSPSCPILHWQINLYCSACFPCCSPETISLLLSLLNLCLPLNVIWPDQYLPPIMMKIFILLTVNNILWINVCLKLPGSQQIITENMTWQRIGVT